MSKKDLKEIYYYETFQGKNSKFWEVTISFKDKTYTTRSGLIGTEGKKATRKSYSFPGAQYEASLLRKKKEKKGYILLKYEELGGKRMMRFKDIFDAFLRAYRWELICPYEPYGLNPTYGWFPDDVYDNNLFDFFSKISEIIYTPEKKPNHYDPLSELKDPNIVFDPNEKIDDAIEYIVTHSPFYHETDIPFQTHSYPEDFKNRVKKWVFMYLNSFFLSKFFKHKEKFTPTSIKKVVDTTVKFILDQTYYFTLTDNSSIEKGIEYIDSVVLWFDKVSLPLLFMSIKDFYYLLNDCERFKTIMYWIKPEIYFSFKNLGKIEILNTLLEHEKSDEIPKDLITNKLFHKIRRFTEDTIMYIVDDFHIEQDRKRLFSTGYRIFLHFAYFGFLDGKVSGIEKGAYSFDQLENELDEFYQYKSFYFKNKNDSI